MDPAWMKISQRKFRSPFPTKCPWSEPMHSYTYDFLGWTLTWAEQPMKSTKNRQVHWMVKYFLAIFYAYIKLVMVNISQINKFHALHECFWYESIMVYILCQCKPWFIHIKSMIWVLCKCCTPFWWAQTDESPVLYFQMRSVGLE